jgi:hypothetical protein
MARPLSPAGDNDFEVASNSRLLREATNEWASFLKEQQQFLKKQRELRRQKKQQQDNNA